MDTRRLLAPALAVLLLAGIGAGIWHPNAQLRLSHPSQDAGRARRVTVRGLIGSEKESFFADP